jgi:phosphomannomutase
MKSPLELAREAGVSETLIASVSGVRGVVGSGLDPVVVAEFASAYASGCAQGPVVVGHDGRVSAPVFAGAVESAVTATGRDTWFAGPIATPTLGWLVREHGAAGGIQISASHNPAEYNGLKFFQPGGMVLSPAQGQAVIDRLRARQFGWAPWNGLGRVSPIADPDDGHLRTVVSLVDVATIRSRRIPVVLDASHGAGGRMGAALLDRLGCQATILGGTPDGNYEHPPEPTETNLRAFAATVVASGASVGFAQDPDADRLAIVDETGRYIGEELTLALAAQRRLTQAKGPVVLNLSTSRVTEDLATRLGCTVHRTPVGEIHVVERMQAEGAILGGEGNGGVIDPRVGFVRDSFIGMALVLELIADADEPLSKLVDRLPHYVMVKQAYPLRRDSADGAGSAAAFAALCDRILQAYPEARSDRRDGLRLDWPDAWAHMRPSNTEPIIRVIAEAANGDRALELAKTLGQWIDDKL